jgi:predicted DNA-binding transcriptional regulator AlpA
MACDSQYVPVHPPVVALSVLNSWKAISSYVGRAVRTIQRWEAECEFPVHRPMGRDRTGVIAFPSEINEWMQHTPIRDDTRPPKKHIASSSSSTVAGMKNSKWQQAAATKTATVMIGAGNLQHSGQEYPKAKLIAQLNTEVTAILLYSQQVLEMEGLPSGAASKLKSVHESARKIRSHLDTAA